MIFKHILFSFLLLATLQYSYGQGKVALNINQILVIEDQDKDNPPTSLYIKLNTPKVDVKYIRGSRVTMAGRVELGIPNLFFLEVLIKKGRYTLFMSPDGGSGLRIEDKARQPMILQGEQCPENVLYTLYIPETITTVVFENALTGETNVIPMNTDKTPTASTVSSSVDQVTIKDK